MTTSSGPNFIGIGAQRAGTSWLYNCIKTHPEVYLPQKEVHFFDEKYNLGIQWYYDLFDNKKGAKAVGEFTPDYMFHGESMLRIKEHCPEAKLIIILRAPVERAQSAYKLFKSHGKYTNKSFAEAIAQDKFILEQSLYAKQLERVYSLFPKEQVFIGLYDDIEAQPLEFIKSVYRFLGVSEDFLPHELNTRKNTSAFSSGQRYLNLPAIQNWLQHSMFKSLYWKFKHTRAFEALKGYLVKREAKSQPDSQLSAEQMSLVKQDIAQLESLLDKPLNHWRETL